MTRRNLITRNRTADTAAAAVTASPPAAGGSTHRPTVTTPGGLALGAIVHQAGLSWSATSAAAFLTATARALGIVVGTDANKGRVIMGGLFARAGTGGELLYLSSTAGALSTTPPATGYKAAVAQQLNPQVAIMLGGGAGKEPLHIKNCTTTGDGILTDLVEVCEEVEITPDGPNGPELSFRTETTTTPVGGSPTTEVDEGYIDNDGTGFTRTYADGSRDSATLGRTSLEFATYDPPNVDGCSEGSGFRFGLTGIQSFTTTCSGAVPTEQVDEFSVHEITVCVDGVQKTMKVLGTVPVV